MPRLFSCPRDWLPLAVLAVAAGGTWAVAQPPAAGDFADEMVCRTCGHTWPIRDGQRATKCPKCGAVFTHVENPDGTKDKTGAAAASNPAKLIALGVGAAVLVLAAVLAVIKLAAGGRAKPGKKAAKRRPRRDEYDE